MHPPLPGPPETPHPDLSPRPGNPGTDTPPPPEVLGRSDLPPPAPPAERPYPLSRFLERAAKLPAPPAGYTPTPAALKLADALFTSSAPSFVALAEHVGLSRTALYDLLRDDAAVAWIVSHGTGAAAAGLGWVHSRLLELALTSRSPSAIELYLKRFDPEFTARNTPTNQTNVQNNLSFIQGMDDKELRAFLNQRRRSLGVEP